MQLPHLPEIQGLRSTLLSESVQRVFADLIRLLGYIEMMGEDSNDASCADPSRSQYLLTTLRAESLVLIGFIEGQAMQLPGLNLPLREALDSICFAIRHEMRRAFPETALEHDDGAGEQVEELDAIGILRNCFQQSYLILARVFNPTLSDEDVFGGLQTRREQSLILWEDLHELLKSTRHALSDKTQPPLAFLLVQLDQFRAGSMRYLMSRDWATFEGFVAALKNCTSMDEASKGLHQLECYLEILLNHVRMRASLSDVQS